MSKLWTSADIAKAVGGTAQGEWSVSGVSIDSRSVDAGDLFVPLKDARDGHEFMDAAFDGGAAGALSAQDKDGNIVRVDDALSALRALGQASVARSEALRIGVTGSVGKTSVKEALALMFSKFGNTHKSLKSYNNHWGVPLTMARMPKDSDFGIFEMGMNHASELSDLSNLLRPNIALITNVAGAHLAHFDSVEDIAKAKAEIIEGVGEDGIVILNADNPYFEQLKSHVGKRRLITFGRDDSCDVTIVTSQTNNFGSNTRLRIEAQQIDMTLLVKGEHWIANGAACMAVAYAAGVNLRKAAMALRSVRAEQGRGETSALTLDGKALSLIDDSYNANPTSMGAAIDVLGSSQGRKIAVLGDMYELGKDELELHAGLSTPLEAAGISRVITVGETMRALRGALPQALRGPWAENWQDALAALKEELEDGDTVLVKASNGVGLGKLVYAIKQESLS